MSWLFKKERFSLLSYLVAKIVNELDVITRDSLSDPNLKDYDSNMNEFLPRNSHDKNLESIKTYMI